MLTRNKLIAGILASASVFASSTVRAQMDDDEQPPSAREIAGHVFAPSKLVTNPFTPTFVDVTNGYGYARGTAARYDLRGNQNGTRSYDIAAISQSTTVQVRIIPALAVRAHGDVIVYAGANGVAALALGALVGVEGGAGATLSFPVGSRMRLGATLDVDVGPSYNVNLVGAVTRAIEAREFDISGLVSTETKTTLTPGFTGSMALLPSLGIGAMFQYQHPITATQDADTTSKDDLVFGAMADFDFAKISPVPIGLVGAYRLDLPIRGERNYTSNSIDLSVLYTGRTHFVVGPELGVRFFTLVFQTNLPKILNIPQTREADTTEWHAQLVFRYYWQ